MEAERVEVRAKRSSVEEETDEGTVEVGDDGEFARLEVGDMSEVGAERG